MKTALVLFALLAQTANAETRDQLDAISKSEVNWSQSQIAIPSYNMQITGFKTDRGTFRMSSLPLTVQTSGTIQMTSKPNFSAADFKQWCDDSDQLFSYVKNQKMKYTLTLHVNPFVQAKIENAPMISRVDIDLHIPQKSAYGETYHSKAPILQALKQQIAQQLGSVRQTGDLVLDLTGWDDVACDFAKGVTTATVSVGYSLESARVVREQAISSPDLEALYNGAKPLARQQDSKDKQVVSNSMAVGASMALTLKKAPSDFGGDDLVSLYKQFFDVDSGSMKAISDFATASSNLDHLRRGQDMGTLNETPQIQIAAPMKGNF